MQFQTVLWIIVFLAILSWLYTENKEGFGNQFGGGATSPGTLIQLVAKGAQDLYLTGFPSGYGYGYGGYGGYGYGGPISSYYFNPTIGYYYPYNYPYGYGGYYGYRGFDHLGPVVSQRRRFRPKIRKWWQFWR